MTTAAISKGYLMPEPPDADGPRCGWPREYHELSLPLSPRHIGTIYLPKHMTAAEWDVAEQVIALIKSASLRGDRA